MSAEHFGVNVPTREIRCTCGGLLRGGWAEVVCDDCGTGYTPVPLPRVLGSLAPHEVVRFSRGGVFVAAEVKW